MKPSKEVEKGNSKRKVSRARKFAASTVAFAYSALCHEIIFWAMSGRVTLELFAFFLVQPLLVAGESALSSFVKWWTGRGVPRAVCVCSTVGVEVVLGRMLFFRPFEREGLVDRWQEILDDHFRLLAWAFGLRE